MLIFLSSVAMLIMSVLNGAISSVAHKVAFLFTKDFKYELEIVIEKLFYYFFSHIFSSIIDMEGCVIWLIQLIQFYKGSLGVVTCKGS